MNWMTVAATHDDAIATASVPDGNCSTTALRADGPIWTTAVPGRCRTRHPGPFRGPNDTIVPTQDEGELRLTSLDNATGTRRWTVTLQARLDPRPGVSGKPAELAADGLLVAVVTDERVVVLDRSDGTVVVDTSRPVVGPIRRVNAHEGVVTVVDTSALHGWTKTGQQCGSTRTGSAYSAALGAHWLWTDPDGATHVQNHPAEPVPVDFPGRLRSGGWLLPDGSWVVGTHISGEQPALVRVGPDGQVVWRTAVDAVAIDGANAAATGAERVPFVVESDAGRRVALVSVADGRVELGAASPAHQLIDAQRFGSASTAGLSVGDASLVVHGDTIAAVRVDRPTATLFAGSGVPGVWTLDDGKAVRSELSDLPRSEVFGW